MEDNTNRRAPRALPGTPRLIGGQPPKRKRTGPAPAPTAANRRQSIYDYPKCPDCRSRNLKDHPQMITRTTYGGKPAYRCKCGRIFVPGL